MERFLFWLAVERGVASSTHRQALAASLFFYGKVLAVSLPWMQEIGRPRVQRRLPVVLSADEVAKVLRALVLPKHRVLGALLYGTNMRIAEALQLRIKDVDFDRRAIVVWHGKGGKDQMVMLPQSLVAGLCKQMARSLVIWAQDQATGRGGVVMPDAVERKYPRAGGS